MGFEGKPEDIKKSIIEASRGSDVASERLRKAAKKSSQVRQEKKAQKEVISEYNKETRWNDLYESELDRLHNEYPEVTDEGEPATEEWYKDEATKYTNSIVRLMDRLKRY